jgi:hypothetical protein
VNSVLFYGSAAQRSGKTRTGRTQRHSLLVETQMSDIFREVDEEVRRDQALQFWQKYQNYVIATALIAVAATGAWKAFITYQTRAAEAAGSRFEAALQLLRDGKNAEAKTSFAAVAADAPAGYRLLANFASASALAATDSAAGASAFDNLASDSATPALMQTVAQMRAALLRLDDADISEIKRRLEPLAQPGKPFRNGARELLGYAALRANDYDFAAQQFDQIVVDPTSTAAQRQRAEAMLGLVQAGKASKSP